MGHNNGLYLPPGFQIQGFNQALPFRQSFSTPNLEGLGNSNRYAPQRGPPHLSRQSSGYGSTIPSTATATPRNLSRPASPTNEMGPSTKKRRGASGNAKLPPGLTMTRMENNISPTSAPQHQDPVSAGGMNTSFFGYGRVGNPQSPQANDPYASGPTTPLFGPGGMATNAAFVSGTPADYQFWSAPTSQQPSRTASPVSGTRSRHQKQPSHYSAYQEPQFNLGVKQEQQQISPEAISLSLPGLPAGFNLQTPPTIDRIVSTPAMAAKASFDLEGHSALFPP